MFIYKRCSCTKEGHGKTPVGEFSNIADQIKILSAPSRIALVSLLYRSPHCVGDLQTHTGLSQTLISHQLRHLLSTGVVERTRDKTFIEYRLTKKGRSLVKVIKTFQ